MNDALWALLVIAGASVAGGFYQTQMDGYEVAILAGSALVIFERGHAFGRFLYGMLH